MATTSKTSNSSSPLNINCSFYGSSVVDETVVATFEYTYSTSNGVSCYMRIATLDLYDANKTQILSDYSAFIENCTNLTPRPTT